MVQDLTDTLAELMSTVQLRQQRYDHAAVLAPSSSLGANAASAPQLSSPAPPSSAGGAAAARSPAAAAYQAAWQGQQARQQIPEGSFLDALFETLQAPGAAAAAAASRGAHGDGQGGAVPAPATVRSLTSAIAQLHDALSSTAAALAGASERRMPELVAAARAGAQSAHAALCGEGPAGSAAAAEGVGGTRSDVAVRPVMADPEFTSALAELEQLNVQLQVRDSAVPCFSSGCSVCVCVCHTQIILHRNGPPPIRHAGQ